jgi:peptidase M23-like protein
MARKIACAAAAALAVLAVAPASAGPGLMVTITSGPEGKVASGDATFTFTANQPASFRCSLDSAPLATCSSPVSYTGLADGDHSFTVQANNRDAAGVPYTDDDTRRWTIDRSTPPPPPPPTGPPDYDGDGLTGGDDHCPSSPGGTAPIQDGCSAVELAADPDPLGDPTRERLGLAFGWLGKRAKPLGKGLRRLRLGEALLLRSLAEVGDGAICRGGKLAGRGLKDVLGGQHALGSQLDSVKTQLLRRLKLTEDADSQAGVAGLAVADALVDRSASEAAALRDLLRRLCEQVQGPLKVDGTIAQIDDARGLLTLADGRTLALADAAGGRLFEGGRATLEGIAFKDGSGVVTKGKEAAGLDSNNQPVESASAAQAKVKCVHFRIAPFQQFAPPLISVDGPYVLHHPKGYGDGTFGGRGSASPLWLEDRMRVGAQFSCKPGGIQAANTYPVHSLRAEITYRSTFSNSDEKFVIADDLREGDTPAPLPSDIDPSKTATLSVRGEIRNCSLLTVQGQPPSCSPPTPLDDFEDFAVRVYQFGSYVNAQYDRTRFELDTKPAGSFQPAKITKLNKSLGAAGQSLTLDAQGWSYSAGNSSRPNLATIGLNQRFAVYLDDFFDPEGLFEVDINGVDDPGALMWPHAKGKRNGHEFWYSVDVPELIRDRVDECSGVDSYYRLPFGPIAGWSLGKGNYDDPDGGHAKGSGTGNDQRYAFDFSWDSNDAGTLGNNGAEIRATRPGEVWAMDEDETGNSVATTDEDGTKHDGPTPPGYGGVGNFTVIRHVDGTFGTYWHTKTNTTTVNVGSHVFRGQTIALGNNTGSSFSPHVHWDVRTGWHLQYPAQFIEFPSKLVKVQDQNHSCWRPRDADTMASNNGP